MRIYIFIICILDVDVPRTMEQKLVETHRGTYRNIRNQLTIKGHQVDMDALQRRWSVEADMCHHGKPT